MPMPVLVASGSIAGTAGIAGGVPTRLLTPTYGQKVGAVSMYNRAGHYKLTWRYICVSGGSAAGTACIPCFTWWDPNLASNVTATGGPFGHLTMGGVTAAISGNAISSFYGLSGTASAMIAGEENFYCGSGASGASAYIQVSSVGVGGATTVFHFNLFLMDDWGV